jgi:GT2 family glycosyltransferase
MAKCEGDGADSPTRAHEVREAARPNKYKYLIINYYPMKKLSVVIVNYNVKYFLEQALLAVRRAARGLDVEVWVVDNASKDGSVELVREHFEEVRLIANSKNVGFSTANNQAIAQSEAEYVLLLNPDTVVAEDTFEKCLAFMDATPRAGGLGVKMIDGTGQFLPESKRGFPSPSVAFYKTFGFGKFFPRSERFNQYYLGHLSKDANCKADVLSGAFMLMRKSVLDEIGYLDEAFFMYGEDIDLSYRIVQAGWDNYYLADAAIIHYKGESTKKGSLNYVKTFYQAMIIFTQKHFSGRKLAGLFVAMLRGGIYFRAFITLFANWARALAMPIMDAILMYGGLFLLKNIWASAHFRDTDYFPDTLLYINFPLYIGVWILCLYLRGSYDQNNQYRHLWSGIAAGTLLVAAIYGLLPDDLRYSRMLIVLGGIWAVVAATLLRITLLAFRHKSIFYVVSEQQRNTLIVGSLTESKRVLNLLYDVQAQFTYLGTVAPDERSETEGFLGNLSELEQLLAAYRASELIFCGADISAKQIIAIMERLGAKYQYKIIAPNSDSIIGSNSKDGAGDLYAVGISYRLNRPTERRNKRVLDAILSLFFLLLSPILFIFVARKAAFFANLARVLLGKLTFVGYAPDANNSQLPKLKKAILSPADRLTFLPQRPAVLHKLNALYAKEYSVWQDIEIIAKNIRQLGRAIS